MCCVFIALPTTLLHNISTSLPPLCANRSFHCPTIFFKAVLHVLKKKERNAKPETFPGRTSNYIKPSLGGQELHKAFPGWCGVIGGGRAPFHPVRFRIPFSPPRVGVWGGVMLFNFCPPYTLWRVAPNNKDRWALMDNTHGPKLNPTANSWSNAGQRWIIVGDHRPTHRSANTSRRNYLQT